MSAVAELSRGACVTASAAVRGVAQEVEVFIDTQVAVVVLVVAGLRDRGTVIHRCVPCTVSAQAALVQLTGDAAGTAVGGVALQVEGLVDVQVAVVVDVVAGLCRRNAAALGGVPLAVSVDAALPASAHVPAHTAVGGVSEEVERFVDALVAVIVDAVAALCTGGDAVVLRAVPGTCTVGAVLSCGACVTAHAAVGVVAEQVEVLVDHRVAVVVDIVADLGRGSALVRRISPGTVRVDAGLAVAADATTGSAVVRVGEQVDALSVTDVLRQRAARHVRAAAGAAAAAARVGASPTAGCGGTAPGVAGIQTCGSRMVILAPYQGEERDHQHQHE